MFGISQDREAIYKNRSILRKKVGACMTNCLKPQGFKNFSFLPQLEERPRSFHWRISMLCGFPQKKPLALGGRTSKCDDSPDSVWTCRRILVGPAGQRTRMPFRGHHKSLNQSPKPAAGATFIPASAKKPSLPELSPLNLWLKRNLFFSPLRSVSSENVGVNGILEIDRKTTRPRALLDHILFQRRKRCL